MSAPMNPQRPSTVEEVMTVRRVSGPRLLSLAAAAAALATAAACGGSSSGGGTGGSGTSNGSGNAAATITISGFDYGAPVTVSPGATVQVDNKDSAEHTVTADKGNAFDDDATGNGTSTFKAPTTAGTYKFHCSFHDMHGSLIVSG